MKNTIKLALVAAMAMGATSAFATNGDQLIGLGAKSRAMGGTGVAHYNGSESALSNPALISNVKGTDFSFGGTYFHPSVEFNRDTQGYDRSEASHNMIPEVSLAHNLGDGWAIGVGMFGTAGMGTDYRNGGAFNSFRMTTNLQLMKFAVPVAYKTGDLSVGFAPVIQYGALDINYIFPNGFGPYTADTTTGAGVAQDFGIGYELGATYELKDMGITLGAKYTSAISMTYEDQISGALAPFGGFGVTLDIGDELEEPAKVAFGIDYEAGDLSVTADFTQIQYGSAAGYKDFNWEDQNVYALGLEYRMDDLALRAGYNYASNCVKESTSDTAQNNSAINFFNIAGFPAVTDSHYTVGAGYAFTKNVSADLAFTYAPEVSETYDASGLGLGDVSVNHKQYGVSGAVNFSF